MLVDITVNGQPVKAVAAMGKQAMLYLFNRATGAPIFPIEERPVPQSDVPGEKTSPTQPFPTKPPPYDHQGVTRRQPDRLHAGAARRSAEDRGALQDRADLHAAAGQQGRRADRRLPLVGRHELARRLVRSRDAHRLRAVVHGVSGPRPAAAAEQGILGSPVRLRQRADRRALHLRPRRERRRGRAGSKSPAGGAARRRPRRRTTARSTPTHRRRACRC